MTINVIRRRALAISSSSFMVFLNQTVIKKVDIICYNMISLIDKDYHERIIVERIDHKFE